MKTPKRMQRFCLCIAVLSVVFFPRIADAHRLDEYLQGTRISIEPGCIRVEMNLTPGAAVAESVIAAIDQDRDGEISSVESAAYAGGVVSSAIAGNRWWRPFSRSREIPVPLNNPDAAWRGHHPFGCGGGGFAGSPQGSIDFSFQTVTGPILAFTSLTRSFRSMSASGSMASLEIFFSASLTCSILSHHPSIPREPHRYCRLSALR